MTVFHRRHFLYLASCAAALPAVSRRASGQAYPTRPIQLVVGFAPGGATDVVARMIGQRLTDQLGQPVIIENRPGAASNLAAAMVAHAAPDGYTLLQISSINSWNTALYDNLKFDFLRDIVPVAGIYRGSTALVVHPSFPATTLPEFIAYARADPGKLRMASAGVGSNQHLYGELFKRMTGIDMLHVPYRGGGPAMTDLLGGHVDVMFEPFVTSIEHIKEGELRALGITAATRSEMLPNVPAIAEVVTGYEATGWQGVGAPANTPAEIIVRLNKEINLALLDPLFRKRLTDLGAEPFATSPLEFGKFIAEYTEKWTKVIREANIKSG